MKNIIQNIKVQLLGAILIIFQNPSSKDILEDFWIWSVFDFNWLNRVTRQKSLAI